MKRVSSIVVALWIVKLVFFGGVSGVDLDRFWDRGDTESYVGPAQDLVVHGVFASSLETLALPEVHRTPGCPVLLVLLNVGLAHWAGSPGADDV